MERVGYPNEGEGNMREFKLGRGYNIDHSYGDVTGRLAPGIQFVDTPEVQYYTTNGRGGITTNRVTIQSYNWSGSILDFYNLHSNNRVFIFDVTSLVDGTIYSTRNGNFNTVPSIEQGFYIRAAIIYL